jgi:hypothetical protein
VFDGGLRALPAANIFGPAISSAIAFSVNNNAANPFYIVEQ